MKKILIIEDDRSIAEVERDYLELSGFSVTIENDGLSGLKRAEGERFDLIIVDLMLPGIDGFAICQQIRRNQNIPIMMITAREDDLAKTRGFELGLDDFLTKPFSAHELVARVKGRLSRYDQLTGKSGEPVEIQDRGLILDPLGRRVFLNDIELQLPNKEFDLLSLLMRHPNQVFSKDQLFERLWDMNADGDISTVTVHIRRLREKIEHDTANPTRIITVWGIGYKYART